MRGWKFDPDSDNFILRSIAVKESNIDILGVAETHLRVGEQIDLEGYSWFGHNRKLIHKNAKTGSGGVGFLIKNEVLNSFNVNVLNDVTEGILWIKLEHKFSDLVLLPCVCYLPPENSSRQIDPYSFFDSLLADFYSYQNSGTVFICGDFNSRCGDLEDFISGIDNIPHRNVKDFKTNMYGSLLVNFLVNTNMCMLNGRFDEAFNDFTSISTKGSSVVDYCLVSHHDIGLFSDFKVVSTLEVIDSVRLLSSFATSGIPDHSLLKWNLIIADNSGLPAPRLQASYSDVKFNLNQIPENFLLTPDVLQKVQDSAAFLEEGTQTQSDIDNIYSDWCKLIQDHMYKSIPHKTNYMYFRVY